jgi:hypothetical protein
MAISPPSSHLGQPMPSFALPTVSGDRIVDAQALDAPVLVVMFICNHCPYVKAIEDRMVALACYRGARGAIRRHLRQ